MRHACVPAQPLCTRNIIHCHCAAVVSCASHIIIHHHRTLPPTSHWNALLRSCCADLRPVICCVWYPIYNSRGDGNFVSILSRYQICCAAFQAMDSRPTHDIEENKVKFFFFFDDLMLVGFCSLIIGI